MSDRASAATLIERLEAEAAAIDALVAICEHPLHQSPVGCPYCKRDVRQAGLFRDAALRLRAQPAEEARPVDNGNTFVFCEYVGPESHGCVRGRDTAAPMYSVRSRNRLVRYFCRIADRDYELRRVRLS